MKCQKNSPGLTTNRAGVTYKHLHETQHMTTTATTTITSEAISAAETTILRMENIGKELLQNKIFNIKAGDKIQVSEIGVLGMLIVKDIERGTLGVLQVFEDLETPDESLSKEDKQRLEDLSTRCCLLFVTD